MWKINYKEAEGGIQIYILKATLERAFKVVQGRT